MQAIHLDSNEYMITRHTFLGGSERMMSTRLLIEKKVMVEYEGLHDVIFKQHCFSEYHVP
jgi:hypothetical protein